MANNPDPGYILVTANDGLATHRISNQIVNLEHQWDAKIVSFSAPSYRTDELYGGFCRLGLGEIVIFSDLFLGNFPPPRELTITCQYATTTETGADTFFSGIIFRRAFDQSTTTYEFYGPKMDVNLLQEGVAYHEDSIFVVDSGTYKWTASGSEYYLELLAGGDPSISEPSRIDENGTLMTVGTKGSLTVGQWAWGNTGSFNTVYVRLTDDVDPDTKADGYLRADYTEDTYAYPRAFGPVFHAPALRLPDAFSTNQRYCQGSIQGTAGNCSDGGTWCVYDDGVDISGNVANVGGNVFELTAAAVGEVTITGTGEDTLLTYIMEWACEADKLNLSYNASAARSPSPAIITYETDQQVLLDFLSGICAPCTHLFNINGSTLYLIDMKADNGTTTYTEFDFFPLTYTDNPPLKLITARWTKREAFEGRTSGVDTAYYIRETEQKVAVNGSRPYGMSIEVNAYHTSIAEVKSRLEDIRDILEASIVNVRIPMAGSLPVPGEGIYWADASVLEEVNGAIRNRNIIFDIDNDEVGLQGEGSITAA